VKRIIVATTFRDFKGNENDNIQHLFLDSILKQKHSNWELAVTLYGEKNVEPTIKAKKMPAKFFNGKKNSDFRFSHSEVLLNGLSVAKGDDIILWTTCDVTLQDNFFSTLASLDYDACTSHPHFMYPSVEAFENKIKPKLVLEEGIDTIAFRGSFLKQGKVERDLHDYRFGDWGIFEHFLVAVSSLHGAKMINLWGLSNISKIVNDRKVTKDGKKYLDTSWKRNHKVFAEFLNANDLSHDFLNLIYIDSRFTPVNKLRYYRTFKSTLGPYHLKRNKLVGKFNHRLRHKA